MEHEFSVTDVEMAAQLEGLVGGELDDAAREPLIAWLDQEPRRWRLCGLLFLEAQTWSEALRDWPAHTPSAPPAKSAVNCTNPTSRGGLRRLRDAAVLAASVLVAFVLGAAMHHDQSNRGASSSTIADASNVDAATTAPAVARTGAGAAPVMAMLPIAAKAGMPIQPALHIPVVPTSASAVESSSGVDSIPDYVRQQWARRGYQLDVERRFLLAKLPGGQQVAVPFEQYSIKPIPPKIN